YFLCDFIARRVGGSECDDVPSFRPPSRGWQCYCLLIAGLKGVRPSRLAGGPIHVIGLIGVFVIGEKPSEFLFVHGILIGLFPHPLTVQLTGEGEWRYGYVNPGRCGDAIQILRGYGQWILLASIKLRPQGGG